MILHPPVLALIIGSLLTCFLLAYASYYGFFILRKWDLASGSDVQLDFERKTYLISTLVTYAFAFQLLSLFLFVYTADDLCHLFVGAMCAAGTLHVNPYGYPTLLLKIINFMLAGVWLILNHVDNSAYDYPLIKKKYLILLLITPSMMAETVLQIWYFLNLIPDIITSCCGTLFSAEPRETGSAISLIPGLPLRIPFFIAMGLTLVMGVSVYRGRGKGSYFFSLMAGVTFILSIMALISVFSLYFYELPSHHCPFCLLQREYDFAGYPLYLTLFTGAVTGISAGVIAPFSKIKSLTTIVPAAQQRLALVSLICYSIFTALVIVKMMISNLTLR